MKATSWKTTLGGALLALGPILKTHGTAPWMYWASEACMVIGALILGGASKDKDITGTGDTATRPKDDESDWKANASGK